MKWRSFGVLTVLALSLAAGCGKNAFNGPANATVKATGTQISLSWSPVNETVGYNVYRGTSPGPRSGKILLAGPLAGTSFVDPAAAPGTTYYYQVTAINSTGDSSPSIELSASTKPLPVNPVQLGGALQGAPVPLFNTVATKAGSTTSGSAEGAGSAAGFNHPIGVTTDGTNLYVADLGNNLIRKVVIATGAVSTLAGSTTAGSANGVGAAASFNGPGGITTDGTTLYVADTTNNSIRAIVIATGEVSTLAGSTTPGTADGAGSAASFKSPAGITTDGSNLYVADAGNNAIRKIVIATGEVGTLAGSATSGAANGTGTAATFNVPTGVATDGTALYVTDRSNSEIRKIVIATGVVSTVAGSTTTGSADGTGTAASFNRPSGITTDGTFLYVTDFGNNLIRRVSISTAEVVTIAGTTTSGAADGIGSAASFNSPYGITTDGRSVYVADYGNNSIREIY